jgi:positive regulator of sigma E activity
MRQAEAAKAACGRCAVRANCLSYALETMPEGAGRAAGQRVASGRTA